MRDLMILSGIIIFWIVYGIFITSVGDDSFMSAGMVGNSSTFNAQTLQPDLSGLYTNESSDTIVIFEPSTQSKTRGFVDFLLKIVTFGISGINGMPFFIASLIVSFNYLLALLTGLIIYRLLRHGGG